MSTLRITNIEAKADPSSPTVDEKIKITNSNGDILVHIDGKTSGITTIGINTTAGNIKFDQNSNVVVTGIITATKFVGTIEPTTLTVGGDLTIPDKIVHTGDTNTSIRFPAADTFTVETGGAENARFTSSSITFKAPDGGSRYLFGEMGNSASAELSLYNSSDAQKVRIAANNATFFNGGNIGIGTDNPSRNLTVASGSSSGYIQLCNDASGMGSTDGFHLKLDSQGLIADIIHRENGPLRFWTNNTERLRIDNSGRLGLGVVPEAFHSNNKAVIRGDSGYTILGRGDNVLNIAQNFYYDSSDAGKYIANGEASTYQQADGQHLFYSAASGSANASASMVERLRIASDGKVHIGGNGTGTDQLNVIAAGGGINISRLNSGSPSVNEWLGAVGFKGYATGNSSSGADARIHANAAFNHSGSSAPANLIFSTKGTSTGPGSAPTERMRISYDGKVRINRTGNLFTEQFIVESDTTTVNPMTVSNTRSSASTDYAIIFARNASIVGSIQTSLSATSYLTSSDHRLKENVVDISDGITRVKQLAPKRFNFIAEPDETVDGFLAHEAQTVVPEAVTGTHDEVDDDGNAVMQGIDQSKLVPLLTAALKEAIGKIETLEAAVTALQGS